MTFVFMIILQTLLLITSASSASFDCKKAKSTIEHAICNNPKLSELDENLSKSYNNLFEHLSNIGKEAIKVNEVKWIESIQSDCETSIYYKEFTDLPSCLIDKYSSRISKLNDYSMPVEGVYRYVVSNKDKRDGEVEYELMDGGTPLTNLINREVNSFVKRNIRDKRNDVNVKIVVLSPSTLSIQKQLTYFGGAYPDFNNDYTYFDTKSLRKLDYKDFFVADKLPQLAIEIRTAHISEGKKHPDSIDCFDMTSNDIYLKLLENISGVKITPTTIELRTEAPHVCGDAQMANISTKKIGPYVTDRFKSFIK